MAVPGFAQKGLSLSIRVTQDKGFCFCILFFSEKVVFLWNGVPNLPYDVNYFIFNVRDCWFLFSNGGWIDWLSPSFQLMS